jgi:putative transposase
VTHLLADLQDRGLDASRGLLVVIDGAKALHRAVRKVFGDLALVQRCTIHKHHNVTDHLSETEWAGVDARLAARSTSPTPRRGCAAPRELARTLQARHLGAAASLREDLEEMFTVGRLGVSDRLARTLPRPIRWSRRSRSRTTCLNVKRWKDGEMVHRWTAAGMLAAERSFRRVKGCKDTPALVAALARHAEEVTVTTGA